MPLVLYHYPWSPPSRFAAVTAKALGLDVTVNIVDLFAREHLTEDFLKINPQHTVPTLDDNGFILWDSHAIATYLVSQYGKDDSLYPKDPKKRAVIDQRLFFDIGTLFTRMRVVVVSVLLQGGTSVDKATKDSLYEAMGFVEKFLEPTGWIAGDHLTIADIALAVSVSSYQAVGMDLSGYPKIMDWLERCKKDIKGFQEVNEEGAKKFGMSISSKLPPNHFAP